MYKLLLVKHFEILLPPIQTFLATYNILLKSTFLARKVNHTQLQNQTIFQS